MKRRGFLGALFGAPAAAVAGTVLAKLPEAPAAFESEPEPEQATEAIEGWRADASGVQYMDCCSVVVSKFDYTMRNLGK